MASIWLKRYWTWRAAGFDPAESLEYMLYGRADWNWWDPVSFGPTETYPYSPSPESEE